MKFNFTRIGEDPRIQFPDQSSLELLDHSRTSISTTSKTGIDAFKRVVRSSSHDFCELRTINDVASIKLALEKPCTFLRGLLGPCINLDRFSSSAIRSV